VNFASPEQAESAFYTAFQCGDLDAMMLVWADDADIACIHPSGQRLVGVQSIRKSWEQILGSDTGLRIEVVARQAFHDEALAAHLVNEHLTLLNQSAHGVVLATNIYRKSAKGWHMVLHHASLNPSPEVKTHQHDTVLH
jgi:ketosteroid isomerase-like protein